MAKYKIIPSSRTIVQSPISIGHKAEKGVEAIEFDLTAWVETYGSGTLTVIMRRWGDAIPYPIALKIDENNKATWTLSDIDTAKAGMAYAQLNYIVGDEVVKKSDIYTFRVMDSLTGEGEPPEAYESWLEHLQHLAAEAMAEVLDIEGVVTDKTLTVDGGIADAKAAGDALTLKADKSTTYTKTEVDQMIEDVEVETDTTLKITGAPADAAETGRQIGLIKADLADANKDVSAISKYVDLSGTVIAGQWRNGSFMDVEYLLTKTFDLTSYNGATILLTSYENTYADQYVFLNSADNVLSYKLGTDDYGTTGHEARLVIPDGAVTLASSTSKTASAPLISAKIIASIVSLEDVENEAQQRIAGDNALSDVQESISDAILNVSSGKDASIYYGTINLTKSFERGKVWDTGNNLEHPIADNKTCYYPEYFDGDKGVVTYDNTKYVLYASFYTQSKVYSTVRYTSDSPASIQELNRDNNPYCVISVRKIDNTNFDAVPTDVNGSINNRSIINNQLITPIEICVPEKSIAVVGHEYNIYWANLFKLDNPNNYDFYCTITPSISGAKNYGRFLRLTPASGDIGTHTVSIRIRRKGMDSNYLAHSIDLIVIADSALSNKKVMFIGDSLTDAGIYPAEIQFNLSNGDIESIGTRQDTVTINGTSYTVKHEGRAGWQVSDYVRNAATWKTDAENPFWDGTAFNFSYYMTQQGFSGVDIVCLNLGTNGVSSDKTVPGLEIMIDSIHAYDPNIIILVSLITPSASQTGWGYYAGLSSGQTFDIAAFNLRKAYIENFEGKTNLDVTEPYFNIDTEYDFTSEEVAASSRNPALMSIQTNNVHPSVYGYLKIADVYYANLLYRLA